MFNRNPNGFGGVPSGYSPPPQPAQPQMSLAQILARPAGFSRFEGINPQQPQAPQANVHEFMNNIRSPFGQQAPQQPMPQAQPQQQGGFMNQLSQANHPMLNIGMDFANRFKSGSVY